MHSHQRSRGKILFEVLCALGLAASFASAWDEIGSPSLLASASIMALFALYWSSGLIARDRVEVVAQTAVAVVDAPQAEVEFVAPEAVFACEPDILAEPEPVAAPPRKRPARKARKAAAVVASMVERPEPDAIEEPVSDGPPLEPLFDPQPFARQPRPAFGRRARGPRPVQVG